MSDVHPHNDSLVSLILISFNRCLGFTRSQSFQSSFEHRRELSIVDEMVGWNDFLNKSSVLQAFVACLSMRVSGRTAFCTRIFSVLKYQITITCVQFKSDIAIHEVTYLELGINSTN